MATNTELRRREIEGLRRLLQRCDDERRGIVSRLKEIQASEGCGAKRDEMLDGLIEELERGVK